MVGHLGARPLEPGVVDARVQALAASTTANPFLGHPAGLWIYFVGPLRAEMPFLAGAKRNRDGEPWIELLSPRSQAGRDQAPVASGLTSFVEQVAQAPLEASPFEGLDATHREWRATGAALQHASKTRGPEGEQRVLAILRTLPAELRRSLGVDP